MKIDLKLFLDFFGIFKTRKKMSSHMKRNGKEKTSFWRAGQTRENSRWKISHFVIAKTCLLLLMISASLSRFSSTFNGALLFDRVGKKSVFAEELALESRLLSCRFSALSKQKKSQVSSSTELTAERSVFMTFGLLQNLH